MAASASPFPRPAPARANGLLIAATIGAALLVLFGLLCLLLYLAWPQLERSTNGPAPTPEEAIAQAAEFGVLAVYGLGVGAALLWQAVSGLRGAPGRRFRPGLGLALVALVLFPLALFAGVAALGLPHQAAGYLFPLPALIAVLAPPLLVISLVQRAGWPRAATSANAGPAALAPATLTGRISREDPFATDLMRRVVGPPTTRRVLGALAWGMAGATLIAIVLEVAAAVAGLALGLLALLISGQTGQLDQLGAALENPAGLDCVTMRAGIGNPLLISALLLAFAVIVPLIEEPAKSLAVVWLRDRLAVPRDALLYGAAAGVGFGMLESAVYNVGDVRTWWPTATLRLGTTFVHALATGLFGVAWFYRLQRPGAPWARRRFRRYALASLGVHGLWNASVIGIIALSVVRVCSSDSLDLLASNDPYRSLAAIVPGVLMVGSALALILLARRLGPMEPPASNFRLIG